MIGTIIDIIRGGVKVLFPRKYKSIPEPIWEIAEDLIPAIVDMVSALRQVDDLAGAEKAAAIVAAVRRMLDDGLDAVPWWADMGEEARDRIIAGICELIYQVGAEVEEGRPSVDVAALAASIRERDHSGLRAIGMRRIGMRARVR